MRMHPDPRYALRVAPLGCAFHIFPRPVLANSCSHAGGALGRHGRHTIPEGRVVPSCAELADVKTFLKRFHRARAERVRPEVASRRASARPRRTAPSASDPSTGGPPNVVPSGQESGVTSAWHSSAPPLPSNRSATAMRAKSFPPTAFTADNQHKVPALCTTQCMVFSGCYTIAPGRPPPPRVNMSVRKACARPACLSSSTSRSSSPGVASSTAAPPSATQPSQPSCLNISSPCSGWGAISAGRLRRYSHTRRPAAGGGAEKRNVPAASLCC